MEPTKITVSTTVNAPVEKAWKAFTTPADIEKWNAAAETWHCPKAENDLQPGGKFTFVMAAKDGSFAFDFGGVYDDVKTNELIAYTIGDGRKVVVSFEGNGDTTTVTEVFEAEGINPIEMQQGGWQAILDSYKKHTESV